ncbi:hypothetical protein VKT23_014397 [Stygiomarasmius scandens]|uniref:Glycosyl transferase CAP10 domain-containing protein n=1 Tax=Marasmiellus scandens TaxID=2682957 RepID=A0ABR1J0K9_9AGAR
MSIEEMLGGKFIADWHGDGGSVWESWWRTCPPNSTARRLFESIRTPFSVSLDSKNYLQIQSQRRDASSLSSSSSSSTSSASGSSPDSHYIPGLNEHGTGPDFSFTPSTAYSTLDFCSSPHAHYSQGHFFSDWRIIPALYPIFSPAKARGFSDIRIPSHYYYGATPRYTYGWDEVNLEFHRLPAKHPKVNALGDEGAAVVGDGLYGGEAGEGGEETVVMDPMGVPWEKKLGKVFWRGATTGGGNNPPGWMGGYQRHRFLRMASVGNVNVTEEDGEIVRTVVFPDPLSLDEKEKKGNTAYLSLPLSLSELNGEIMDVAFTKAVSAPAYPGGLDALLKDYRWSGSVALGHHWQYKYLLDLDGMSYSGRFLAFLESGSVPVKATVYDEWWAVWCVPWVHFIPLSTSYKEIYNIHAFFSGPPQVALKALDSSSSESESESESEQQETTGLTNLNTDKVHNADGDARLRRIARAGRQWKKRQGRRVDMELYVYRLALEWARLWAADRDVASMEL